MRKLVSVYNRCFRSLNSTGPHDPTTTVFMVDAKCEFPQRLVKADAVRFLATEFGGIIWATDAVRESISRDGYTLKAEVLGNILANVRQGTTAQLDADFIDNACIL